MALLTSVKINLVISDHIVITVLYFSGKITYCEYMRDSQNIKLDL